MLKDIILSNRSYRRFYAGVSVSTLHLEDWIDLARLSASGKNNQPLKYIIANSEPANSLIFDTLAWAGLLKDWPGPAPDERPSAYIIMLGDTRIAPQFYVDHGIAAQSILLGAVEAGYGGCMIMAIRKNELRDSLHIDEHFEILMVLAIGKPKENIVLDEFTGDTRYWRDAQNTHHVPKRSLNDIIIQRL
jgi:nitroreductase